MSACGYKLILLGIIVTFSSWETVVTAQGDPAHVVVVNSSNHTLNENETFWMYIHVTGNPDPVTTLFAISTGKVIFRKTKKGFFNITMPSLNCSDTGIYALTCDNQLANTSKTENLSVWCSPEPDANYPIVSTITPRLHDNVNLTLHATGYPTPNYQWFHNGTRLFNHTDTNYTTMLILNDLSVHNYGDYVVLMRNSLGNDSVLFSVKADGPPDPVTDLAASNITDTTANLTFTTGYDYNNTQTFVVHRDVNGTLIDFRNLSDIPSDYGGRKEFLVITELEEFTDYNLTILSRNIRGDSISRGVFVNFTTKGEKPEPNPKYPLIKLYKPRLGDKVILTIHALHHPNFRWMHNGKNVTSRDNFILEESEITIERVDVDDFGDYILIMTNPAGSNTVVYSLLAEGPPEPVSHVKVANVSMNSANITFNTGYDYNDTQTFIIKNKSSTLSSCEDTTPGKGGEQFACALYNLTENTIYNITVISRNSRGESKPNSEFVAFSTYGVPKPDPAINGTYIFTPRIPEAVTMTIHAVGYPPPKFEWWHNGTSLNSSDTNYTSSLTVKILDGNDFGKYVLNMTNKVGIASMVYQVLAEGPPEPVSDIKVANISINSADITFTTGYDYNNSQTFMIINKNSSDLSSCEDTTSGKGRDPFACALYNLTEDTIYNITVISSNSRGESKPSSEFVAFSTYGVPKPDPAINGTYIFSPRIPDDVTMTIHAVGNPPPKFDWWHDGKSLNGSDANYTSSLTVKILDGKDFGKYVLNMMNKVGNSSMVYQVLAEGPPDAVSNLNVTNVTETSANITFTSGYDYNDTQTFVVLNYTNGNATKLTSVKGATHDDGGTTVIIYLDKLKPVSNYNITVVSINSRGESTPVDAYLQFETLGKPAPDPSYKDNVTATPRLGSNITLMFHAVGNPLPSFQWYHDNKPLGNSSTGHMTSLTLKNFIVSSFGTYLLNMRNDLGETNVTFNVTANGPPDPVRDLVAGEVTSDSVQLYWRPGFNYGSDQTFTIYQVGNEKELQGKIEDTTKGNFSMNETYKLTGLSDSTTYTVYLMAINEHGKASQYSNSVNFTTSDSDDGGTTAEIVGYVVGGIGFVVLILVIISLIRCYMARRGNLYENLQEEEPQHSGFDDAGAS